MVCPAQGTIFIFPPGGKCGSPYALFHPNSRSGILMNDLFQNRKLHGTHLGDILLDWFARHQRDLPWRRTYTPYHVWISEIMLQQTQMDRGVQYFQRWIQHFPDIRSMALASEDEILKHWEGLGYYSRARNLHRAAQILCHDNNCELPREIQQLLRLPGIGPYTARAIASIAFEQDVCVVDANVERLVSRIFNLKNPVKSRQTQLQINALCEEILPPGRARAFNQAAMEFGSLVCVPRKPACGSCPVAGLCEARLLGVEEERPVGAKPVQPIYLSMSTGVLIHEGRILVQKRQPDDVWANLWEFPGGLVEEGETPAQAVIREFMEETRLRVVAPEPIALFKHAYTRYRVTLNAFFVQLCSDPTDIVLHAAQEYRWSSWKELQALAFPAGHRKLIAHLNDDARFQARVHP